MRSEPRGGGARARYMALVLLLGYFMAPCAGAAGPEVVASIRPVHALVAGVMQGVGEPALLIKGAASPHDFSLRPADVRAVNNADMVFWVGDGLEFFLAKMLQAAEAPSVALAWVAGVELLGLREGGLWDDRSHEHGREVHSDNYDPHIWLDPHNAIAMVRAIGAALAEVDPDHHDRYQANVAALITRLQALDAMLRERLAPVKDQPYIVFHDAFQYFERRYGLAAAGSVTLNPETKTGARRISDIRRRIAENRIACVFSEPQFEPGLVRVLIENTPARTGVLDPVGEALAEGPDGYFELLIKLADSLLACLAG